MQEVLLPIAVLGTISLGAIFFTKTVTDYILRKKMIDKGYINEEGNSIFNKTENRTNKFGSLKWGLIIFFTGISLVLLEFISYSKDSPFPFGFVAVFAAAGFLTYYFMVKDKIED